MKNHFKGFLCLFSNSFMTVREHSLKKPFDVICCLYKMKQVHWLLCITRNCDWSRKIMPLSNLTQMASLGMETYSKNRIELWNLQMLKKMLEKSTQFLSSEQLCGPKSLNVSLNIAGVERIHSENMQLWSTPQRHLIWVLNERRFSDGGNLCPLWLVILKLAWHGIRDTLWLQYSWPQAVVNYTFLAVVPWNGLEHSHRKVRLRVYFNWI